MLPKSQKSWSDSLKLQAHIAVLTLFSASHGGKYTAIFKLYFSYSLDCFYNHGNQEYIYVALILISVGFFFI